jgi:hypothetical protein
LPALDENLDARNGQISTAGLLAIILIGGQKNAGVQPGRFSSTNKESSNSIVNTRVLPPACRNFRLGIGVAKGDLPEAHMQTARSGFVRPLRRAETKMHVQSAGADKPKEKYEEN